MEKRRTNLFYRILSCFIVVAFVFNVVLPPGYAQLIPETLLNLPAPGAMVAPSAAFVPVLLKGMTIHPDNPLQFDFIIDSGNTNFKEDQIKAESQRLVKYFLASMTIPKDDLWVNLSPYQKDRIIPDELGKTDLGRDMLAQDYILKQLTASLMYPEKELGKEFWDKVYQKAKEKFGTTQIPVNTFNKVWILPETATVYEHGQTVYIVEARLKVMLDSDYLATQQETKDQRLKTKDFQSSEGKSSVIGLQSSVSSAIIKEVILPAIEKEVNEGQNFAPLRQIYHSLILAKWYKETIKNSLLSKIYVDQKKIAGVNLDDATLKDKIYAQYMEAYKKGVFNYIKEDYDRLSNETIPRKYFSGGIKGDVALNRTGNQAGIEHSTVGKNYQLALRVDPQKQGASSPITIPFTTPWYINRLKHDNSGVRAKAARVLGERGDPVAVQPLIPLLGDFDSDVRQSAAEALGKLGDTRAVSALIERLGDYDYVVYAAAVEALGKLGASKEQMVDGYIKALGSSDSAVEQAATALGELGDTRAVEPLERLLSDTPPRIYGEIEEVEETGFGGSVPDEWTRAVYGVESNPVYVSIKTALEKLLSGSGGTSSSPLESRELGGEQGRTTSSPVSYQVYQADGTLQEEKKNIQNFDNQLKAMWNEKNQGGIIKNNVSLIKRHKAGDFVITFKPDAPVSPISEERKKQPQVVKKEFNPNEGFTSTVNQRLFELNLDGSRVRIQVKSRPDFKYHFLCLPEAQENRPQLIKPNHVLAILKLLVLSTADNIKFGHNSWGAGATVNRLHVHGIYNPEGAFPIEGAETQNITTKDGVNISEIVNYPARGFIFKSENISALAEVSGDFIKSLQDKNIPYNIVISRKGVYVLPREFGPTSIDGQELMFGYLEMAGEIGLPGNMFEHLSGLSQSQAQQVIATALQNATINTETFNKLKEQLQSSSPIRQGLKDYQYETMGTLNPEILAAIMKLEENIETGRRMQEQVLRRFLDIPGRIALLARDSKTNRIIGYIFGLPQQAVLETRGASIAELRGTFYEMSWQVLPEYQEEGIGSALRYMFRNAVRNAGYKYIASHQNDIWDENAIKKELSSKYAQGDELFSLQRGLPSRGGGMEQQYLVIKLAQSSSPASSSVSEEGVPTAARLVGMEEGQDKVGGIDMNSIDVDRQGAGVDIQFDPAELQEIIDAGIDGFAPVIINITPLPSVLPLLGLEPANKEEQLEISSLNKS